MSEKTPPYVRKILDISTAHVSEVTSWYLNQWSVSPWVNPVIIYPKGEYGWFVYIPSEPGKEQGPDFPTDLRVCMEYARSLNCDWIMFDRDGVTIDALPVYDW